MVVNENLPVFVVSGEVLAAVLVCGASDASWASCVRVDEAQYVWCHVCHVAMRVERVSLSDVTLRMPCSRC